MKYTLVNTDSRDSLHVKLPENHSSEPKNLPTAVQMTDELINQLHELLSVANNVTSRLDGAIVEMPNGGDGTLPDRMSWCIDLITRVISSLRHSGEFLG